MLTVGRKSHTKGRDDGWFLAVRRIVGMSLCAASLLLLTAVGSFASGTLNFRTYNTFQGPFVHDTDGSTRLGADFKGQIYAGPAADQLSAVGQAAQFGTENGTPDSLFLGAIVSVASEVVVPAVGDNAVGFYQIRAWDGAYATFEAARASVGAKIGMSDVVQVTFGSDGGGGSPSVGPDVNGFQSFSLAASTAEPTYYVIAGPLEVTAGFDAGDSDGIRGSARFNVPRGVAVDSAGNILVADSNNRKIRKIDREGVVTTVAGSGEEGVADLTGTAASFVNPSGVAVDSAGNIYVAGGNSHKIRKISPAGEVSTLAGTGSPGADDGPGASASFNRPHDLAVDSGGNVYVADHENHKIRKITQAGEVSTLAGSGAAVFADGQGAAAGFKNPYGLDIDAAGNIFVADRYNHRIRKITPAGEVSTVAGSGGFGVVDGPAASAEFRHPLDVAIDARGAMYVADEADNLIRKIGVDGQVSTLFGSGATAGILQDPFGISVDGDGNLVVADSGNSRIVGILVNDVAPIVEGLPETRTATEGESVSWSVTVHSLSTPTFQWFSNSVAIAGADTASLNLGPARLDWAAEYSVVVSNASGRRTNSVSLTVTPDSGGQGGIDHDFYVAEGLQGAVNAIAIQPDGRVLIGGVFGNFDGASPPERVNLARLNEDGSLDATFAVVVNNAVNAIALQPDGRIVIGGDFTSVGGVPRNRVARLNADGSLDALFLNAPASGFNGEVNSVLVDGSGRIVVGGAFTAINGYGRNRVARLNADGSLDTSFDPGTGADAVIHDMEELLEGGFLAGGAFTSFDGNPSFRRLVRLGSDGSPDAGFLTAINGTAVHDIEVQPDGRIVLGGDFNVVTAVPAGVSGKQAVGYWLNLIRLNSDGRPDATFDTGGNPSAAVRAVDLLADGRLLIGGDFTSYDGTPRLRVARVNADGSLDAGFDPPGHGVNDMVKAVAQDGGRTAYIGGAFTGFNDGRQLPYFARLHSGAAPTITVQPQSATVAEGGTITLEVEAFAFGSENLLSNSGFEDGLSGWSDAGGVAGTTTEEAYVYRGSAAGSISNTFGYARLRNDALVGFRAGRSYRASAFVKDGYSGVAEGFELDPFAGFGAEVSRRWFGDWERIGAVQSFDEYRAARIWLLNWSAPLPYRTYFVDDFELREIVVEPFAYQWFKDGEPLPGETDATLTLAGVMSAVAGVYTVKVSASGGVATSEGATLALAPSPPVITLQPVSRTVNAGESATFSVSVSGSAPMTNQWRKGGVDIPGATGTTLTISDAESGDTGLYSVAVSNAVGSVTSSIAGLRVYRPADSLAMWGDDEEGKSTPPPGLPPLRQVSAGGHHTLVLGEDGVVRGWGLNTLGQVDIPAMGSVSMVAAGGFHSVALLEGGSVVAWGQIRAGMEIPASEDSVWAVVAGPGYTAVLRLDGTVGSYVANNFDWGSEPAPDFGQPVKKLAGGTTHLIALLEDGSVRAWGDNSGGQTDVPQGLQNVVDVAGGVAHSAALLADGSVVVWGGSSGGWENEPVFKAPLVAIASGHQHVLAIDEEGELYAWGGDFYGQATPPASYSGVVGISGGWNHSAAIYSGPYISRQPQFVQSGPFNTGDTVTITVVAGGDPAPGFRWRKDGNPLSDGGSIAGSGSASLTISPVALTDSGTYDVVVENQSGMAANGVPVVLEVGEIPTLALQLAPQSVCAGAAAVFMTQAAGTPPPSFVWRRGTVVIPDETGPTLAVMNAAASDSGIYSVQAVNNRGESAVSAAALTVVGKPMIVAQPALVHADKGGTAILEVKSVGATSFKWFRDGVELVGESGPTLVIGDVQPANAGEYTFQAHNDCDFAEGLPIRFLIRHLRAPRFSEGKFGFNLDGESGQIWIFQVSSDLTTWTEVGRVTLDSEGVPTSISSDPGMTYSTSLVIQNGRVMDSASDPQQTTRMYRILKP